MARWLHLAVGAGIISSLTGHEAIAAPTIVAPSKPSPASVQTALDGLVSRMEQAIGGRIGVSVRLLETGEGASVNATERFPMASTYKVAVAGVILSRVDRGELRLGQMIPITQRDFDETGQVADHLIYPGVSLSVENLLELMLTQSNNTATDKMFELAGGPEKVTAWLRANDISGMRVDRNVNELLNDFTGISAGSPFQKEYMKRQTAPDAQEQAAKEKAAGATFAVDPRDTTVPPAMTDLMVKLFASDVLKPESRDLLISIMERCETGLNRIRGLLPDGTVVADKTGTIGGTINDVGMMILPQGRGRLLIAVYTKDSSLPADKRERVIAEISRSAFDYFAMR